MESAATIADAARRLEEAAAIFRFRSRAVREDYDGLAGRWTDARARDFSLRHLQPQGEVMEQGARLCGLNGQLADSARTGAETAEHELYGFYNAQADFESSDASSHSAAQTAGEMAARSTADSSRAALELQAIQSGIQAAAQDPGW